MTVIYQQRGFWAFHQQDHHNPLLKSAFPRTSAMSLHSPANTSALPTNFPVPCYASETCLDTITTLPSSSLRPKQPKWRFPGAVAPLEPYLSHLPPERLGLERASQDGLLRPRDYGSTHPDDPDVDKTLYIGIELEALDGGPRPTEKERRWGLAWIVPDQRVAHNVCVRLLTLQPSAPRPHNYYINYGPQTHADFAETLLSRSGTFVRVNNIAFLPVSTKMLDIAQRQELEGIAWNVGVLDRDGYNSQNWVACVMAVAVARGILDEEDVRTALSEAVKTKSPGKLCHPSLLLVP